MTADAKPSDPRATPGRTGALRAGAVNATAGAAMILIVGLVGFGLIGGATAPETQWLGMEVEPLSASMRAGLGLPPDQKGVLVSDAVGLALASGIKEGDVIVAVDGKPIETMSAFVEAKRAAGDLGASLTVNRQGSLLSLALRGAGVPQPAGGAVAPAAFPQPTSPQAGLSPQPLPYAPAALPVALPAAPNPGALSPAALGFEVADLSASAAQSLGLLPPYHGVLVVQVTPGSPAAQAGLAPNDVIVHLNGFEVVGRDQLVTLLAAPSRGAPLLDVYRSGRLVQLPLGGGPIGVGLQVPCPISGWR